MCELCAYCAALKASAVVQMTSSLFRNVTQRKLVVTDVSGQNNGPNFKGQTVQKEFVFGIGFSGGLLCTL
jgi:hypothetical protein